MPYARHRRSAWLSPLLLCAVGGLPAGCSSARTSSVSHQVTSGGERPAAVLRGEASYYASSLSGRRTASGERYNPRAMTAASRTLPFGTRLRVTRVDTGRSEEVRVNDRGPFGRRRRILDLSRAAADKLDMVREGHVEIEAVVLE